MIEVLLLAIALSMDAFAVSLGIGIKDKSFNKSLALKSSLFFGLAQGIMPLFGYFANEGLSYFVQNITPWLSATILIIIGAMMIYEEEENKKNTHQEIMTNRVLFILAIATSIDAMATGFTLGDIDFNPYIAMIIIGISTFIISFIGVYIGSKGSKTLEDKAEKIGGVILIAIGLKILYNHLF